MRLCPVCFLLHSRAFIILCLHSYFLFFFFNDTATTEIYTLSLHDALPICPPALLRYTICSLGGRHADARRRLETALRSEEHTSELQSQSNLVCRLLLEKKKKTPISLSGPHITPR